jgi:hypothetical protein
VTELSYATMNKDNPPLVTNEPIEFEK